MFRNVFVVEYKNLHNNYKFIRDFSMLDLMKSLLLFYIFKYSGDLRSYTYLITHFHIRRFIAFFILLIYT